mgnify:FL=1
MPRGAGVVLVEELDDVEAALIDVEMDVAHLEVRCFQLPLRHLGMGRFDGGPGPRPNALAVNRRVHREEQDLALIPVDCEDGIADADSVLNEPVRPRARRVQRFLDVG